MSWEPHRPGDTDGLVVRQKQYDPVGDASAVSQSPRVCIFYETSTDPVQTPRELDTHEPCAPDAIPYLLQRFLNSADTYGPTEMGEIESRHYSHLALNAHNPVDEIHKYYHQGFNTHPPTNPSSRWPVANSDRKSCQSARSLLSIGVPNNLDWEVDPVGNAGLWTLDGSGSVDVLDAHYDDILYIDDDPSPELALPDALPTRYEEACSEPSLPSTRSRKSGGSYAGSNILKAKYVAPKKVLKTDLLSQILQPYNTLPNSTTLDEWGHPKSSKGALDLNQQTVFRVSDNQRTLDNSMATELGSLQLPFPCKSHSSNDDRDAKPGLESSCRLEEDVDLELNDYVGSPPAPLSLPLRPKPCQSIHTSPADETNTLNSSTKILPPLVSDTQLYSLSSETGSDETIEGHDNVAGIGDTFDFDVLGSVAAHPMILIEPSLPQLKEAIVDRIMQVFRKLFNQLLAQYTRGCATDTPTTSSVPNSGSLGEAPTRNTLKHPRRREDEEGKGSEDDSHDDERKYKKIKDSSSSARINSRVRFACPFRKHDSRTYCVDHWRICATTSHITIARVKEHLYRYHRVFQCPRCKEPFKRENEVDTHLVAADACEPRAVRFVEGVTPQIERVLRNRKKAHKQQTEEERWKEIYQLLFPMEPVPSPYFDPIQESHESKERSSDSQDIVNYEQYLRRELPRRFRTALEEAVNDEAEQIERRLTTRIMEMYQECQELVLSSYNASLRASKKTASSAGSSEADISKLATDLKTTQPNSVSDISSDDSIPGRLSSDDIDSAPLRSNNSTPDSEEICNTSLHPQTSYRHVVVASDMGSAAQVSCNNLTMFEKNFQVEGASLIDLNIPEQTMTDFNDGGDVQKCPSTRGLDEFPAQGDFWIGNDKISSLGLEGNDILPMDVNTLDWDLFLSTDGISYEGSRDGVISFKSPTFPE